MSSLNFMELCRLCLVKERVSIPIFEGEGDVRQILLKIAACLPVKIARDDKLPKKICDECMYKLDNAYQFWNTTANSEKQLIQWLGDVANEDRKNVPSNTIETEQLVLKEEAIEQETPDVSKNLTRVEAVLDDERGVSDDEDTESEEEGSNSEDTGDDEPPGKEEAESEEEPYEPLEPTTFVNVSLAGCDEAGPSGIQQPATQSTQQQIAPSTSSAAAAPPPAVAPSPASAAAVASTPSGSRRNFLWILDTASTPICVPTKPYVKEKPSSKESSQFKPVTEINKGREILDHKPSQFNCHVCNKSYKKMHLLRKHVVRHDFRRPFKCDVCHKTFKSNGEVKSHRLRHTGEKKYNCDLCEYAAFDRYNLNVHRRRHTQDYKFTCDICGQHFYSADCMKKHMARHEGIKEQCEICGKSFTKSSFPSHRKIHDPLRNATKLPCGMCDKTFRDKNGLCAHRKRHLAVPIYECDICNKTFKTKSVLRYHYHNHTGGKPFVCEICGKSFTRESNLSVHVRIHTGEKKYHCDKCDKSFTQSSSLVVHMRYHTGQRPYKCYNCGKGFVTKTLLGVHLKTHST